MIGYIIIAVVVLVVSYIAIIYFKNSKKIKKSKETSKPKDAKKEEKVEVESKILNVNPVKAAVLEENSKIAKQEIEEAFVRINEQREAYQEQKKEEQAEEGYEYMTELEKSLALDYDNPKYKKKHLKSETAKIGEEGPSQENMQKILSGENNDKTNQNIDDSLATEIQNLSPELKAMLLNDILNNKK